MSCRGTRCLMALSTFEHQKGETMSYGVLWILVILLSPVALILLWWAFVKNMSIRLQRRYKEVAQIMEMQYIPPRKMFRRKHGGLVMEHPSLTGHLQGFQCQIWFDTQKRGSPGVHTVMEVYFPRTLQMGLKITPEIKAFTRISSALGNSDIQINDEVFDRSFHIQGANPNQVFQFLTPECKMAIYQAQTGIPNGMLLVNDFMVQSRVRMFMRSPQEMIYNMKLLLAVAQSVFKQ